MNKPRVLTVGVAALFALPSIVTAVDRNWTGGGTAGVWADPLNWDTGVPTTGTADNIFVRLPGTITAPEINAGVLRIAVGTPGEANSGFTFGTGNFTFSEIQVSDAFNGLNPASNRYGRAFINAGTTIAVGQFFVGERNGGTGHVIQAGGDVTVNNQFRVGHWPQADVGGGTASTYTLNGGSITLTGDPADPFNEGQAGNVFLGIDSTGALIVNGGVFTAKGITLDNRAATGGEDTLEINGGVVNIGANGIVSQNALNPSTYEVKLSGGALRATASWTSNLETTLIAGGSGITYDTNGNTITVSGSVNGAGGLNKIGAGVLVLSGPNTYTGTTTINEGAVQIGNGGNTGGVGTGSVVINAAGGLAYSRVDAHTVTGPVSGTGQIAVNSGTLQLQDVSGSLLTNVGTGSTLAAAGTLGAVTVAAGGTIEAGVGGAGNLITSSLALLDSTVRATVGATSTKVTITNPNGFVPNGANTIQINAANLTAGTYQLIDYAGTLGGAGFGSFTLTGLPARATGSLVHNVASTSIDLNVTAIDFPKWTGAVDGEWDTVKQNWQLIGAGTPTAYLNFDAVIFDDTATGTTTVNLAEPVTPSAVTFNNPTKAYVLTGPGGIAGTTGLTKQGLARTTLTTANTYTGPTNVEAGVLQIGNGSVGSLGNTNVTISTGAAVELNILGAYGSPTSGSGTLATIGDNSITLNANTISGDVQFTISGSALQTVSVENQPQHNGTTLISGGTLRATGAQSLGTTTGNTIITNGGTLDVNNLDLGGEHVVISGTGVNGAGAIVNNGTGSTLNLHRVTLAADASVGGTGRWDIRTTGLPNELLDLAGHKLTKVGSNQVSVVNVDVTPGDIDVVSGTFSLEDNTSVQGTGTITLNAGGALGLWVNKPGRLTRQIVANGGSINELGSNGSTTVDSPISMQADLTFNVAGDATVLTHNGNMTEVGGSRILNLNGPGRLILQGTNTFTGGFNVNSGVLQVGNGNALGNLGAGPGTVTGTLVLARNDAHTLLNDINPFGAAGTMILAGGGNVTLGDNVDVLLSQLQFGVNGQNDTIGGTLNIGATNTVRVEGAFVVGNSGGGGAPNVGVINQTGGTVDITAPNTDGRNFVLGHWPQGDGTYNQSGGVLNSPNISMAISWDGSGRFNLSGGVANVLGLRFGHNINQSGVFNLTGGMLMLGSEGIWEQNAAFPNDINLGGGVISPTTNTTIFLPAELTGTNGNVTFDTNGFTLTAANTLSGAGGLVKAGQGTLVLSAPNSYTGTTAVNAGTLLVTNTLGSGTGSGNLTIATGAKLAGTGIIGEGLGSIVANVSGILDPGNAGPGTLTMNLGSGTLDISGAVIGENSDTLVFDLGVLSDRILLASGGLTIGSGILEFDDFVFNVAGTLAQGNYLLFDSASSIIGTLGNDLTGTLPGGLTGTLELANGNNDLVLKVVPEPGSTLALLGGFGVLLARRRRRDGNEN